MRAQVRPEEGSWDEPAMVRTFRNCQIVRSAPLASSLNGKQCQAVQANVIGTMPGQLQIPSPFQTGVVSHPRNAPESSAAFAPGSVVNESNTYAIELVHNRITNSESVFAELILWRLSKPVKTSSHGYKYRLAYVVRGECVLRYDNELGKGDHRHFGGKESAYTFTAPDHLIADFQTDIARWNRENRSS